MLFFIPSAVQGLLLYCLSYNVGSDVVSKEVTILFITVTKTTP